ncbi:hypothetical protein CTP10_R51840 [Cupriavidus sp. P-10]|uniref:hypothetical protein n=1 Tax=Cupriavidus sp. P-10 TaxID=2027911 RepID=UPI001F4880B3|nr:hypothetical protein [Cupriavidus sp. P-10]BDB27774.1 hypothetical protein CTP10_R51840 [Cupriavidus sp. P-10]
MESTYHQGSTGMPAIEAAGTGHQHPTNAATILRRAAVSGACASLLSSGMLACGGTVDCGSAFAPVNAVSHWIWGERALHANRPSVRHTVLGYVIHHAMSVFWAVFYETAVARHHARGALGTLALGGLGIAGLACLVDLKCTPHRLTPGFERRLSAPMLTLVYLAFGLALPLGSLLARRAARSRGSLQGPSEPIARLMR